MTPKNISGVPGPFFSWALEDVKIVRSTWGVLLPSKKGMFRKEKMLKRRLFEEGGLESASGVGLRFLD